MIEVVIKEKKFSDNGKEVITLNNLSFTAQKGETVAIVGPTGCGKTTLLRIIAGLDTEFEGAIKINETEIHKTTNLITMMFQQQSLFPWLTLQENIAFSLKEKGMPKVKRIERANQLIKLVDLNGFGSAYPHTLSGGMQQRGVLARALAYDTPVLLLDEPFAALDDKTRRDLQNKLLFLQQESKKTIIIVTHNIDEAIYLADRIMVMKYRPSSIHNQHSVSIPHPRERTSQEFSQLHLRIREEIHTLLS